jgi:hypothetical protein
MSSVVDSKHQELSNEEIIQIATQETGSQYSPEQVTASIMAEAHKGGAIMMREGNTLFIINKSSKDPSVGVFRALNADTAQNYLQNSMVFVKAAVAIGFKTIVATFYDASLLSIFKYISRNPPFPGMGYAAQRTKDGGFRVTVNLGSGEQGGLPNARLQPQQGTI